MQLRRRYSAARKTAATIVKQSKEKSWEEFGQKLDTHYRSKYCCCRCEKQSDDELNDIKIEIMQKQIFSFR